MVKGGLLSAYTGSVAPACKGTPVLQRHHERAAAEQQAINRHFPFSRTEISLIQKDVREALAEVQGY